jgi:hypothetical protein
MRMLFVLLLSVVSLTWTAGCGGRPDPRANPDFDQAAYDDVDAASDALFEEAGTKR